MFRYGLSDPFLLSFLPHARTACVTYPVPPFGHLKRLTDNIGLLRDADGVVPLHEHGYYADDVARGLLVVCREPSPSQELC